MKPGYIIAIVLVGVICFVGARMNVSPKLKRAQQSVQRLQSDKQVLEQQLEALKDKLLTDAERERIEKERKELASLRGEVAALRGKVEELTRPKPEASTDTSSTEEAVAEETPFEESDYYSAAVNVLVEPGMTIVTGGWQTFPGKRTFVFMTPSKGTSPDGGNFIQIATKIATIANEDLSVFHLQNMKTNQQETDQAGGFDTENARLLFEEIEQAENASMVGSPTIVTADGREAVIQTAFINTINGEKIARNLEIGVIPALNENGSIEMNVATTITDPNRVTE